MARQDPLAGQLGQTPGRCRLILVDTSVWIDFFRPRRSPASELLAAIMPTDEIAITGLICAEILQGISDTRQFAAVRTFLLARRFFEPAGRNTYVRAAALYAKCRRKGLTIRSVVDCVIASVALENSLAVLHRDRDYGHIASVCALRIFPSSE